VRYHSLAATEVVEPLRITARSEDGVVQGIEHSTVPLRGVQFHPESILTEHGETLLENFATLTQDWHAAWDAGASAGEQADTGNRLAPGTGLESQASLRAEPTRVVPVVRAGVPYTGDAAVLFDVLHGVDSCAVLLDENLPGDPRGRVSILGAPTGPHGRIAEARVAAGTVTITDVPAGTDQADSPGAEGTDGAAENV